MSLKAHIPKSRQTAAPSPDLKWIGKSINRVEDPRLLRGKGNYVDDVVLLDMAHAAVLRSPHAHAKIISIDKSAAEALPGVLAVVTGAEAAEMVNDLPTWSSPAVPQPAIANEKVRHVGEAVVAVVAESRYLAEDGCDLVVVEYEPLPVVSDMRDAMTSSGDAVLHPERGDNNIALARSFKFGPVDEDFEKADIVIEKGFRWPRSGGQPLETVGAVAEFDSTAGKFTIHSNTSMYNYCGWMIAETLRVEAHKLNIVPVMAGGSFGSKMFTHKVPVIAGLLARHIGRPVKYIEDRIDNTTSCDNHGSDRIYTAKLALNNDGTLLSLKTHIIDDYGAYLQFGVGQHGNALAQCTGPYQINSVEVDLQAVLTNKCQQGAYRGFGSEVANFVIERMVDAAADKLGRNRLDLRRQNMITADQFPYLIPTGNMYDSGNYQAVLKKALERADLDGWRKKQEAAKAEGRYIGIGISTCQERSVFSSTEFWMWNLEKGVEWSSAPDAASVKIDPRGKAVVTLHSPFWGNSPETVATQVLAEQLTMDPSDIEITYSDMDQGLPSVGPAGSRFTVMVTGALVGAATILRKKMLLIAGHVMDLPVDQLELKDGAVRAIGRHNQHITIPDIADLAHYYRLSLPDDPELTSGLDARYVYDHPVTTFPDKDEKHMGIFYPIVGHSCHIAVVEVDPGLGSVEVLDFTAVHDCGTIINPKTLEGHIKGGILNGIGTTFMEEFSYDDQGQPKNVLLSDYLHPSMSETPLNITVDHVETPSPFTEYGVKGGGEGGRMGSPPALVSAVEDALREQNIWIDFLPITPARLRALIREAAVEE